MALGTSDLGTSDGAGFHPLGQNEENDDQRSQPQQGSAQHEALGAAAAGDAVGESVGEYGISHGEPAEDGFNCFCVLKLLGQAVASYPRLVLMLSALLPVALSIWGLTLPMTIDTGLDAFKIQARECTRTPP